MKYLIVGLGNPGAEYEHTRHNVGFQVLDSLLNELGGTWSSDKHVQIARSSWKGRNLILLKPQTYMNLSGKAVSYWMQQEKIKPEQLLIITDDIALPPGKLRLKLKGSDGGHNGLKSINASLNMPNYPRLRFGVGNNFFPGKQVEYVLGVYDSEEKPIIEEGIQKASEAVKIFVTQPSGLVMTQINAK
jgi:PTH1 family peptidyl-tRNA hydrolase